MTTDTPRFALVPQSNCGGCGESCQGDTPCIDGSCGKCMSGQYETKAAKCSNALSMTVVGPRTAVTRLPASIIVEVMHGPGTSTHAQTQRSSPG